jgi:hypothetical protein
VVSILYVAQWAHMHRYEGHDPIYATQEPVFAARRSEMLLYPIDVEIEVAVTEKSMSGSQSYGKRAAFNQGRGQNTKTRSQSIAMEPHRRCLPAYFLQRKPFCQQLQLNEPGIAHADSAPSNPILSGPEIMARTRARLAKLKDEPIAGVLPTSTLGSLVTQTSHDPADEGELQTWNEGIQARIFCRLEGEKRLIPSFK